MLGVSPVLGRTFAASADLSRIEPEAVLSYGLWQRRYGGAREIIGQSMTLDGRAYTIVGVMPARFAIRTTELAESRAELWTPLALIPGNLTGMGGTLNVVARLRPDVTVNQAQSELGLITQAIEQQHPSYSRDWRVEALPLLDATVIDVRPTLLVLFGAVGILLVMACANVANLILGRATVRQTELAIRRSLGATEGRLLRQLLAESLVLAVMGGGLGVLLATWGTELLVSALPAGLELPRVQEISVDRRVLLFAAAVTIFSAILFGLVPSIRSALSASQPALQDATRGKSTGRSRNRITGALVIAEVALALILLAGAGLVSRSFWELIRVHPGFEPDHVLTMRTTLPASKYDTDDRLRAFSAALLERIENLPGVRAVGSINYLPMSRFGAAGRFEIEGRPEARIEDQKFSWVSVVGGRYFEAMSIPLRRGRLPGDSDSYNTRPILVVDEQLASRYWPNANPVGARLVWHRGDSETLAGEIVGVVGSVRWQTMAADPPAMMYWWFPSAPARDITIVVRTGGSTSAMAGLISRQVRDIDPNQPVSEIRSMTDIVSADLARPRFTMLLIVGFAAAALLMAAIGLYGVIAFSVAQSTREIGVRVALGAQYRDVLHLVMRRGALLVGSGLVVGIVSALVLGRFVASLLYGVTPSDPATLLAVTLFLAAVALLATYLPACRATRVDPMVALKAE
jgi:putative ABC transport system permease protein